ncbi:MAG: hypothetical protein LLG00_16625 [Planctomycetaceae bacterium]|nr:hypothetical protein [Planctomycetaceae bacterium]
MVAISDKIGVNPHAELLGEVVTWDMGSVEVPFAQVQAALVAAGLPADSASELRAQTAFTRAVKELRQGRTIDRVTRDKTTGVITFQFTRKHLDDTGLQIDFEYEALCHLDTEDGSITCDESPSIQEHARLMFAHALAHRNTSDVTRLVQHMFQAHADLYPINPKKGVAYFVPEAHRDFAAKVEEFLRSLGGRLLRFPVPKGTSEGNAAVKASVEDGLRTLAGELEEAVEAWDEKTRESTFEKAIERWQRIKHKAEAYSEYLGDRQATLLAKLDEQKRRLTAKVAEITAAKDSASHGDATGQAVFFPTAEPELATA